MHETAEDRVWRTLNPDDMWILDKLILSKKMGYNCGPVGIDVPVPDWYIVRPCVNPMGLGLGAKKVWINKDTDNLPLGFFWCEWFTGKHLSVDYHFGSQDVTVQGIKPESTFTQWSIWKRTEDVVPLPDILTDIAQRYEWINCEFIGGKLIEVHLRHNEDFEGGIDHFIPVWKGQNTHPPKGYAYIDYPDVHGRIGAFVK
jgi:hypothetical protein